MMMVVRAIRKGLFESVRMQHEALSGGQLHLVLLEDLVLEDAELRDLVLEDGVSSRGWCLLCGARVR